MHRGVESDAPTICHPTHTTSTDDPLAGYWKDNTKLSLGRLVADMEPAPFQPQPASAESSILAAAQASTSSLNQHSTDGVSVSTPLRRISATLLQVDTSDANLKGLHANGKNVRRHGVLMLSLYRFLGLHRQTSILVYHRTV